MKIYLDNSATTQVSEAAAKKAYEIMTVDYGNPSSLHHMGVVAESELKLARKRVAELLGRDEKGLIFTSSGTEANNLALKGLAEARKKRGNKIITSKIEHPSVLEQCKQLEAEGFQIVYLDVDEKGLISKEKLKEHLDDNTILVSIMFANNEIGTRQPIKEISELKKDKDFILHTDFVQGLGKAESCNIPKEVDVITVSGHKIHAPKGIGALWIKDNITVRPILFGGGQEKNIRSGTENLPAIGAFGVASAQALENIFEDIKKIYAMRKLLFEGLTCEIKDIKINTPMEISVPSVLNVSFLGVRAEVLLHTLEQKGIYISTGSACSSHKKGQSHVLKAIKAKEKEIEGAVRFSFSRYNTFEEINIAVDAVKSAVDSFRSLGSFR